MPGRTRFGTTTPGSFTQYFGTALGREIGIPLEAVPYRGARPLVADLEQGRIPAGTGGITSFLVPHRGGRLRLSDDLRRQAHCRGPERADCARAGISQAPAVQLVRVLRAARDAGGTGRSLDHGTSGRLSGLARSPTSSCSWASRSKPRRRPKWRRASPRTSKAGRRSLTRSASSLPIDGLLQGVSTCRHSRCSGSRVEPAA